MPEITWDVKRLLESSAKAAADGKEVNIVSWNERAPKIDIRPWDGEHKNGKRHHFKQG